MAQGKATADFDLGRLQTAMQRSRLVLKAYREQRVEAIRQFAGRHALGDRSIKRRPVNMLSLYCRIITRSLVSKNPRVMLSTFNDAARADVSKMQGWANKQIQKINLAATLRRVITDALFSIGVCKVALTSPADSMVSGWQMPAGMPFVERIDLDDFVFDVNARDISEAAFIGHRYRTPLEAVKDSSLYNAGRKKLEPTDEAAYNREGDQRASVLGRLPYMNMAEDFEDYVDLWEIYLPRHKLVLTLADDMNGELDEPLRVQEWIGPPCGPIHVLGFGIVPGNPMPKAPIMDLLDIDEQINLLWRKLFRQSERQKNLLTVPRTATEDGDRIRQSSDGEIVPVDSPDLIKSVSSDGPNQGNQALAMELFQVFSKMAGNLEMMGGLAPQSKTARQDQLLAEQASAGVADLQEEAVLFVSKVCESLCWFWHHHPALQMRTKYSLPTMPQISITRTLSPQQRSRILWDDLELRVDPYSLRHQSPQERANAIMQLLQQLVIPLAPLLQSQGIALDMHAVLQKLGDYLDLPDLAEILSVQSPPESDTEVPGEQSSPMRPGQTERRYVRENRSETTGPGRDRAIIQALLNQNPGGNTNGARQAVS